jgi:hypothetical protein
MTAKGGLRGVGEPISLRSGEIGGNRVSLTRVLPCRCNWLKLRENVPLRMAPLLLLRSSYARPTLWARRDPRTTDNPVLFREHAWSNMVRNALQNHAKRQPAGE